MAKNIFFQKWASKNVFDPHVSCRPGRVKANQHTFKSGLTLLFFFVSFLNELFGFPVFNSTLLNDVSCKRERSDLLRSRSSAIVLLTTNWAEEIMFLCKTLEHNDTSVFYYQVYENFYLQFKCKKYFQITWTVFLWHLILRFKTLTDFAFGLSKELAACSIEKDCCVSNVS